jgi:hypothetical protein
MNIQNVTFLTPKTIHPTQSLVFSSAHASSNLLLIYQSSQSLHNMEDIRPTPLHKYVKKKQTPHHKRSPLYNCSQLEANTHQKYKTMAKTQAIFKEHPHR